MQGFIKIDQQDRHAIIPHCRFGLFHLKNIGGKAGILHELEQNVCSDWIVTR